MDKEIKLKHILALLGTLMPLFIVIFIWINSVSNNQVLFSSKIKTFEATMKNSVDSQSVINKELTMTLNKLNITLTALKTEVDTRNELNDK